VDAEAAWEAYFALAQEAGALWRQFRMQNGVARTDGTAGLLYGKAYKIQEQADAAYRVWLSVAFPSAVR